MAIATIGLDLTKPNFPFVGYDPMFKEVRRKTLKRNQLPVFFEHLSPCQVGIELCAGSHFWGRRFSALGHDVRIIPTHYISQDLRDPNKGYFNDARVLAAALQEPAIPTVPIQTLSEQERHIAHRLHSQGIRVRTAHCNLTRKMLVECGIQLPKGVAALRRQLPGILEDEDNSLSECFRRMLARRLEQLLEMDSHLSFYESELLLLPKNSSPIDSLDVATRQRYQ